MVGIYSKAKKIMRFVQEHAPQLNEFYPGLGELVRVLALGTEAPTDVGYNAYQDYQIAKRNNRKYMPRDFVSSVVNTFSNPLPLTGNIGENSKLIDLKD
jgi:hypothetical protein